MDAASQYVWNTKFIDEIEQRPGIWNKSIKTRDSQKQQWEELSELYDNKSVDSLKRKYNKLKFSFRQQLSRIPHTNNQFDIETQSFESEWPHYRQMLFLLNEIATKPTEKRKAATSTEPYTMAKKQRVEDVDDKSDDEKQCGSELSSSTSVENNNQIREDPPTEIEVKSDIFPNAPYEDGLYHFLMGLYDCMNELDPLRKINVQAKIYLILSQEVAASRATNN